MKQGKNVDESHKTTIPGISIHWKKTHLSYSRSSYDISVKDEKGEIKYGRLPLDYMLHVEFADGTNRNFLICPLYPIGNKNMHGRDLYWNNLRMILRVIQLIPS